VIERDPWGGPYGHLASRRITEPADLKAGRWIVVLATGAAVDQKHVTEAFRAGKQVGVAVAVLPVENDTSVVANWFGELEEPESGFPRTLAVRDGEIVLDVRGVASAASLAARVSAAFQG
jgi:hypothetical protein